MLSDVGDIKSWLGLSDTANVLKVFGAMSHGLHDDHVLRRGHRNTYSTESSRPGPASCVKLKRQTGLIDINVDPGLVMSE